MSLTVVHLVSTGHVVGALTGVGLAPDLKLPDLAGPHALVMHLRTGDNTLVPLPLPVAGLNIATLPDFRGALVDPMVYALVATPTGGSKLDRLTEWGSHNPVALSKTKVTVTLEAAATADTVVLVVVSGAEEPLTGKITKGNVAVDLPVALDAGTYGVLLLIAGRYGRLDVRTVV